MKTWTICTLSFLAGGTVAAFFGLKMLTASWQAEVLVQNDIYARHLKYIANDDIDTLLNESCMALGHQACKTMQSWKLSFGPVIRRTILKVW